MAQFVRHEACHLCPSSDAKAVYDDESWHCFSCGATSPSEEYKEEKQQSKVRTSVKKKEKALEIKPGKAAITREELQEILQNTSPKGKGYRGITDETYAKVGVRHEFDEKTGEVVKQYYPVTRGLQAAGYKIRYEPKNFSSVGATGKDCDLFMQRNFQNGGKYVLIVSGECDAMAAYQMLKAYYVGRSSDFEVAVVSGTTGDKSIKQIAAQYKFFETFDNIVVGYDNDASGNESVEDVVKALPKGKTRIMKMTYKDANEYLMQGKEALYLRHFFDATPYVPVGVVGSGSLYDKLLEQQCMPKIPFPPFMKKLNDVLAGGMTLGHTYNIASGTGLGKTTYINEILYHWVFHSPYKIGIVTMELDSGQYAEALLSRHIQRKIALIADDNEKDVYLRSSVVKERAHELFFTDDDSHRFYLLDNRDGSVQEIQDAIEELVISCNCKVIVIDPLQDVIEGLSNEDQALFMKWVKGMQQSHGIAIVLINHLRKSASGASDSAKGEDYTEQEIIGSGSIVKSASVNILLSRDKYAEDPIERNTTKVRVSKNRRTGITGPVGEIYYDNETHTLHDKEEFFQGVTPESV